MHSRAMSTLGERRSPAEHPEAAGRRAHCDFCRIASGEARAREVLRTDAAIAFFPLFPAAVGHTLLVPRTHVPDIWALDAGLAGTLAESSVVLADAIRSAFRPDGLSVIQSNGAAASQTVMHLHVHLVPRWEGDALPRLWPPRSAVSERRLDAAGEAIRRRLGAAQGSLHDRPHQ